MLVIKPENVGLQVVDSIDVTYSSRPKFSLVKCFRNTVHFLFSQVGLCALVLVYALVGGAVFGHLEQTNEIHECKTKVSLYEELENQTIADLFLIAENERQNATALIGEFRAQLRQFLLFVAARGVEVGKAEECDSKESKGDWTFADALLFSVTVFTTIGYGNVAPKTFWGRLVCICYAMLGIPLMLLCLGNLATVLGDAFRYVYSQVLCCGCCVPSRRGDEGRRGSLEKSMKNLQVSVSPEQWMRSYEAVRAAGLRNNCASPRLGPESPPQPPSSQDESSEDERTALKRTPADQKPNSEARNNTATTTTTKTTASNNDKSTATTTTQNPGYDDNKDDDDKDEKIGIPLTVSLGLIAAYLLFGSVLFCHWEALWKPLDSAYYCFVTISTVGFGDLVPGAAGFHADGDGWRMVGASLYMLVGMALLSMCFNLIQDEIAAKCIRLGQLVGLIDK